jgi:D-3-phosphoglycerate dehydrogenase / 2-oxoglutarate reductase
MFKVLITTVPFGDKDSRPLDLLKSNNINYIINPIGRKLTEDELVDMVKDFDVIIAGTEKISAKVMEKSTNLKMISRVGIGLDSVDLLEAERRGIIVSYTPDAPAPAVVDLTMGLMYTLLRKVHESNIQMHQGKWHRYFGNRLDDSIIGIIGVGRVGSKVIKNLLALGCKKILYYDKKVKIEKEISDQVTFSTKEYIYQNADIISLHLPLDSITRNMITRNEIKMMKKTTFLINTSRGGIVNEQDLYIALKDKIISGAAIDVFHTEPYDGSLVNLDNCILTAHMGSMTIDCRTRMEIEATEEAVRFLTNKPLESVVPQEEYNEQVLSSSNEKK